VSSPLGYKPYTGKVSREYQDMGRLKPDLNTDELLRKRANADRVKMFSRNLRVINKVEEEAIAARAPSAPPKVEPVVSSKVERMREYAKAHVPKPRARPSGPRSPDGCVKGEGEGGGAADVSEELDALALLEKQHAEHVAQVSQLRAELGL
jgi:hypothetical protein